MVKMFMGCQDQIDSVKGGLPLQDGFEYAARVSLVDRVDQNPLLSHRYQESRGRDVSDSDPLEATFRN